MRHVGPDLPAAHHVSLVLYHFRRDDGLRCGHQSRRLWLASSNASTPRFALSTLGIRDTARDATQCKPHIGTNKHAQVIIFGAFLRVQVAKSKRFAANGPRKHHPRIHGFVPFISAVANAIVQGILPRNLSTVVELHDEHAIFAISPHLVCLAVITPMEQSPAARLLHAE